MESLFATVVHQIEVHMLDCDTRPNFPRMHSLIHEIQLNQSYSNHQDNVY